MTARKIIDILKLATGGGNLAINPFRPADWDGKINSLKVLCSACLGQTASERDKTLKQSQNTKKK